ncbi:Helix-turn-helix domain protein [Stieleria neptunia]|uniref:Helix-turn-helix domain protein n=1 Tax=Stieleria neptunia TaxID=2527979 RepID=A0A518HSI4_9BACT|nr:helix-turn-helix domain-containing protein [Stieleria neptunia]QDV43802.1 Helix-turn-helix domain protein [Stieleria neptunia]
MNSNEQDRKSDLYTVKQAASYLQVSVATVYTLVSSGKLGCHRVGSGRGACDCMNNDTISGVKHVGSES